MTWKLPPPGFEDCPSRAANRVSGRGLRSADQGGGFLRPAKEIGHVHNVHIIHVGHGPYNLTTRAVMQEAVENIRVFKSRKHQRDVLALLAQCPDILRHDWSDIAIEALMNV